MALEKIRVTKTSVFEFVPDMEDYPQSVTSIQEVMIFERSLTRNKQLNLYYLDDDPMVSYKWEVVNEDV